jgi:1-aminocyclopropane-1-carboxylate deaminase/D-cysteine desulfhydrase-like pyridoxal-dependent ACC family enzyme
LRAAPRLADALGVSGPLLVKRDDLTGFAVAGNKARPLEVLVAEAQRVGADVLVTGGATSSNFCAATVAAARWAGLDCVLVYAGREPAERHPNHAAAVHWGAELRWTGDPDRSSVDAMLDATAAELVDAARSPYVMPRGGANPLGATGFHRAALELDDQLGDDRPGDTVVVVATGSGGTTAGLLAGAAAVERRLTVAGASVSRPPGETRSRVIALAEGCADLMGGPRPGAHDLLLHDARGPGHGVPSDAGRRAADLALETEGLVLDPVYSAKALAALPALLGTRITEAGLTTVFWHTGGLLDAVAGWSP